jgi:hypothetical protein
MPEDRWLAKPAELVAAEKAAQDARKAAEAKAKQSATPPPPPKS